MCKDVEVGVRRLKQTVSCLVAVLEWDSDRLEVRLRPGPHARP